MLKREELGLQGKSETELIENYRAMSPLARQMILNLSARYADKFPAPAVLRLVVTRPG